MKHRKQGYKILSGRGLEVGAANNPADLPGSCDVEYCDVVSKSDLLTAFPEVEASSVVEVDHLCDLDRQGLSIFAEATFDFVVLNHVIEHVANPINVINELFRVTKPGGHVVISAPDKRYTFDAPRELTPFEHLHDEYQQGVTEVSDEHYVDFLRATAPQLFEGGNPSVTHHVAHVKNRREHAHVWDSASFQSFLSQALDLLNVPATCLSESFGDSNQIEYFGVWQKGVADRPTGFWQRLKRRLAA